MKLHGKLKSTHIVNESSPSIGLPFLDMETSEPWTGQRLNLLISSVEDSPAKTSVARGKGPDSVAHEAASGPNTSKPLPRSSRSTSSSKTFQPFALEDWIKFSGKSLRSGMMRNGIVYPLPPLALLTGEIASGLWPMPKASDGSKGTRTTEGARNELLRGKNRDLTMMVKLWPTPSANKTTLSGDLVNSDMTPWDGISKPHSATTGKPVSTHLTDAVKMWPTPCSHNGTGGATGLAGGSGNRKKLYKLLGETEGRKMGCQSLNPYWVEWLMGYPIGWTDLEGSATPRKDDSIT